MIWYQLTALLFGFTILSIPFGIAGNFAVAFKLFFFFIIVPIFIFLLIENKMISYLFDNSRIVINRGIIFKVNKSIPYSNIQNIKVKTGPLLSIFGLANILIWTASQGQLSNKGIKPDGSLIINKDDARFLSDVISKGKTTA